MLAETFEAVRATAWGSGEGVCLTCEATVENPTDFLGLATEWTVVLDITVGVAVTVAVSGVSKNEKSTVAHGSALEVEAYDAGTTGI